MISLIIINKIISSNKVISSLYILMCSSSIVIEVMRTLSFFKTDKKQKSAVNFYLLNLLFLLLKKYHNLYKNIFKK